MIRFPVYFIMCFKTVIFVLIAICAEPLSAADISTHTFLNCSLPDTGQTGDYTATLGEDHDYQPTGSRPGYTIYNPVGVSSVTVDNRTGLMWVTNPNDAGIGATYTWENAITACETSGYAGYTDWRMPNIKELVSIADYSRQSPGINTAYFLNAQSNYYWSSTTYMPDTTYAWLVGFGSGGMYSNGKVFTTYVRCVRGGQ